MTSTQHLINCMYTRAQPVQKSQSVSALPTIVTQKIILPVCKGLMSGIFIKIKDRSLRWEETRHVFWTQPQPLAFLLKILKFHTRHLKSLTHGVVLPILCTYWSFICFPFFSSALSSVGLLICPNAQSSGG